MITAILDKICDQVFSQFLDSGLQKLFDNTNLKKQKQYMGQG